MAAQRTLGINGLGRIGKLRSWYHLGRDDFDRIVINTGRQVGTSLDSIAQYISRTAPTAPCIASCFGNSAEPDVRVVDEERGS